MWEFYSHNWGTLKVTEQTLKSRYLAPKPRVLPPLLLLCLMLGSTTKVHSFGIFFVCLFLFLVLCLSHTQLRNHSWRSAGTIWDSGDQIWVSYMQGKWVPYLLCYSSDSIKYVIRCAYSSAQESAWGKVRKDFIKIYKVSSIGVGIMHFLDFVLGICWIGKVRPRKRIFPKENPHLTDW